MSDIKTIPILLIMLFSITAGGGCRTKPPDGKKDGPKGQNGEPKNGTVTQIGPVDSPVEPETRQNGFLNPSLYQVFVTVFASEEKEARRIGLATARQKTLNLWRKYLPDNSVPGDKTLREMRRIIERDSRIAYIKKESDGSWSVWIRISRDNLRSEIRNLR